MSAVPAPVFDETPQRIFPRHRINVPLDLIALRSGVPENLPGRCTDISEAGVGAVVAGELATGQQVAVELRLPNIGVPVRARALVRYQSRFHCGLEFVGLAAEQRETIRYWGFRSAPQPTDYRDFNKGEKKLRCGNACGRRRNGRRNHRPKFALGGTGFTCCSLACWHWPVSDGGNGRGRGPNWKGRRRLRGRRLVSLLKRFCRDHGETDCDQGRSGVSGGGASGGDRRVGGARCGDRAGWQREKLAACCLDPICWRSRRRRLCGRGSLSPTYPAARRLRLKPRLRWSSG